MGRERGSRSELALSVLHLFGLASLSVAQPLLDLLGRHAEIFVVRRFDGSAIVLFALALTLLPPVALALPVVLGWRISRTLGVALQRLVVAILASLLALEALTRAQVLDGAAWLAGGLVIGAGLAFVYHRWEPGRSLCSVLALGVLVVPASFLLRPDVSRLLGAETAAAGLESGADAPVVLLLFDELSTSALLDEHQQIDAESYPNLAAFARQATWFRRATAVSPVTELAVPGMLGGQLPDAERLPVLADYPRNLFTALGDYRLWAREPITRLCPEDRNTASQADGRSSSSLVTDLAVVFGHLLLPPQWAGRLPPIADRWQGFGTGAAPAPSSAERPTRNQLFVTAMRALHDDRLEQLESLEAALVPGETKALYFLHVLLPHSPWEYLPSGKAYSSGRGQPGLTGDVWGDDEHLVAQGYQRYLLQIQMVDRWLGRLFGRLRQLQLFDQALIVLAADHGVSFRPGQGRRGLSAENRADLLPVPLMLKAPGQQLGAIDDRLVSTVDVLPTILDVLGAEVGGWTFEGASLIASPATQSSTVTLVAKDGERSVIEPALHEDSLATLRWKLRHFPRGPWSYGVRPELHGRPVAELPTREQETIGIRFTGESLFRTSERYSPALVTAALDGVPADDACCEVAVAVNGTVWATTRTYPGFAAEPELAALVPDEAFTETSNLVEVFRIDGEGAATVLERLGASSGASLALEEIGADGRVRIRWDDRELPVRRGARGSYRVEERLGRVTLSGWCVGREGGEVEQLAVFYRGELIAGGRPSRAEPSLAERLGARPGTRAGFRFHFPQSRVPELTRFGVRVFALTGEVATELGFSRQPVVQPDGRVRRLRQSNGVETPVSIGALAGAVTAMQERGAQIELEGWAADVEQGDRPEEVVAFAGERAVASSRVFSSLPSVTAELGLAEELAIGFRLRFRATALGDGELLRVFAVRRDGQAAELAPEDPVRRASLCRPAVEVTLLRSADGTVTTLRAATLGEVPVEAGAVDGEVEWMTIEAHGARIRGWAADLDRGELPDRVVVASRDQVVIDSPFFVPRPLGSLRRGQPLLSGFDLFVPDVGEEELASLEVFAVARSGLASPLERPSIGSR